VTGRTSGLTLLEMLVAVAILGVVASVLYGSFSRTLEARNIASDRAEVYSTARVAMDWLEQDLKGSLSVDLYMTGKPRFFSTGHGGEDTLTADQPLLDLTVRTARRVAVLRDGDGDELATTMADQARVVYRVEEESDEVLAELAGTDGSQLTLVRYELRPPLADEEIRDAALRTVVARRLRTIDLRFEDRGTIVERWEQTEASGLTTNGPRLVEIRLVLEDSDGEPEEFATSVLVPLGGRRG
jgi:prepilin-type N-terminal cleavage/methylation domain-containing protein